VTDESRLPNEPDAPINPVWVEDAQRFLELGDAAWHDAEWQQWQRYARALVDLRVVELYPLHEVGAARPNRLAANAHGLYVDVPLHWEVGQRAVLESMRELVLTMRAEAKKRRIPLR
jgi:hypothetical protein